MAGTEAPVAREELERLVHEYRRIRQEHRHARRGGRLRRRLGARLHDLDRRFEHVLAAIPLEDASRREWRDHLHQHGPTPASPPPETPLPLGQGASVRWPAVGREAPVIVHVRGSLPPHARDDLEQTLSRLVRLAPRPPVRVRGSLERLRDPALARPVVAKALLDLGGAPLRAQTAAATPTEAIDLLEARVRRSLRELAERDEAARHEGRPAQPGAWRHGDRRTPRPAFFERPPEERRLLRRKSFAAEPMTPEEAAWEMRLLDHDFHLFADAVGEDALVYTRDDGTLGLKRIGGGADVEPFLLDPEPAQTLTAEEAVERLNASDERFLFFVEREAGRGSVVYRRYDGHYGIVTPREPGAAERQRLVCAQCGRVLPDDETEAVRWRHGYLALAGELDAVSAGMLLCPDCAEESVGGGYDAGVGG